MEINPYHDVVQYERCFGKQGRAGDGIKIQFVVYHPVVDNATVLPADFLRTGPIGDDLEAYLLG